MVLLMHMYEITHFPFVNPALLISALWGLFWKVSLFLCLKLILLFVSAAKKGDAVDYQKQLKQMLKDLAKEKDTKTEKELPKMSQVRTLEALAYF